QVASTALAEIASTTPTASSTSPETAPAAAKVRTVAAATTVTTPIVATFASASAVIWGGAVLRWIVLGSEIRRRRLVGVWLTLVLGNFGVGRFHTGSAGLGLFDVGTDFVRADGFVAERFVSWFEAGFGRARGTAFGGAGKRFTRQDFDG